MSLEETPDLSLALALAVFDAEARATRARIAASKLRASAERFARLAADVAAGLPHLESAETYSRACENYGRLAQSAEARAERWRARILAWNIARKKLPAGNR